MPQSDQESNEFYRQSLLLLQDGGVPFLIGGAYAFCVYTSIARQTKDFDLFVRQKDFDLSLDIFRRAGHRAEKTFPHWLGKVFGKNDSIDIIYQAGNGLCTVEDGWFERARQAEVFEMRVKICAPEEMIWMKAYIMERERFDGADVAHLFFHCGADLDWEYLLRCFGPDWRVLLSHLVLFGFIYPSEKERVPVAVLEGLIARLRDDELTRSKETICRGTLLSRAQYLPDVRERGFRDGRLEPRVGLTPAEIEAWTEAVDRNVKPNVATCED